MEKRGSDYRKAFGQFSSNKTQRPNTLKAAKVELNYLTLVHMIDFNKGDIVMGDTVWDISSHCWSTDRQG